jgi:hypothetical protein
VASLPLTTILSRFPTSFSLPGAQIAHACLIHQCLQFTPVLKSLLNFWHYTFRYINRNALSPSTPIQYVTAMAFPTGAHSAVLANTRALAKRKRALRNWPEMPYRFLKPLLNVLGRFVFSHTYMRTLTHIKRIGKFFLWYLGAQCNEATEKLDDGHLLGAMRGPALAANSCFISRPTHALSDKTLKHKMAVAAILCFK